VFRSCVCPTSHCLRPVLNRLFREAQGGSGAKIPAQSIAKECRSSWKASQTLPNPLPRAYHNHHPILDRFRINVAPIFDHCFIDSRSQFRMKIDNFLGGFSRRNFTTILLNFYIPKKGPTFKNHWFFQYKLMNFTCWLHSGSHQTTIKKSTILGPKNDGKLIKK
jgi:hypothetical protein